MLHEKFRSLFVFLKKILCACKSLIKEYHSVEKQTWAAKRREMLRTTAAGSNSSHRGFTPRRCAAGATQMLSKQDLCYGGSHFVILLVSAHWLPSSNWISLFSKAGHLEIPRLYISRQKTLSGSGAKNNSLRCCACLCVYVHIGACACSFLRTGGRRGRVPLHAHAKSNNQSDFKIDIKQTGLFI